MAWLHRIWWLDRLLIRPPAPAAPVPDCAPADAEAEEVDAEVEVELACRCFGQEGKCCGPGWVTYVLLGDEMGQFAQLCVCVR